MKKIIFILLIGSIILLPIQVFTQVKPDIELTKEEAAAKITEWQAKVAELTTQLNNSDADLQKIKKELDNTIAQFKDCSQAFYKMIGITPQDMENFRQKLGLIEGRIREFQKLPNDVLADKQDEVKALNADLDSLRMNKIAIWPEFFDKIVSMAAEIKGLYREKSIKSYTVGTWAENRDCLWNIAGKMEIYGDPFQWPRIWTYNTEIIRNPDIIHPGQVLKLPPPGPKTNDDIKAERKYWRNKREAMENEKNEGASNNPASKTDSKAAQQPAKNKVEKGK